MSYVPSAIFLAPLASDDQLTAALKGAVDGVIGAQDAMVASADEMAKLGSETAAQAGEASSAGE